MAITIFDVPVKGSFLTLLVGTTLFVLASTSIGIFVSSFTKSQTAAIFGTCIITILPSINFSGLLDPITSLEGLGSFVGDIFPTSYYLIIARGVFSKGLGFEDLSFWFIPILVAFPVILTLCTIFLRKQER
jgi:ribosome-dependent ATPase